MVLSYIYGGQEYKTNAKQVGNKYLVYAGALAGRFIDVSLIRRFF